MDLILKTFPSKENEKCSKYDKNVAFYYFNLFRRVSVKQNNLYGTFGEISKFSFCVARVSGSTVM